MATLADGTIRGLANHTVIISRQGEEYDIADSCAPISGRDRQVVGAVLVFRNVTEDYAVQQALRDNTSLIQTILNTVADGIITLRASNGMIETVNPTALRMFGFEATTLTTIYILIGNLVLSGFCLETLRRAHGSPQLRTGVGVTFILWNVFLIWRLSAGQLFSPDISPVIFAISLFGFVGVVCAVALSIPSLRETLASVDYDSLLIPQGMRMFFGAGFLIEGVLTQLPQTFSILDGLFHITSAFLALKSGLLWAQRKDNKGEIWFANLFGLIDIIIVALGIPFSLLAQVGPNHNMMYAAFFAAPLFVLFHVFSLAKLMGFIGQKASIEVSPSKTMSKA